MAILRLLCLFNILIFILFYHASLDEAKELRDNSHKLINHAFSREIKNRVVSLVTVWRKQVACEGEMSTLVFVKLQQLTKICGLS